MQRLRWDDRRSGVPSFLRVLGIRSSSWRDFIKTVGETLPDCEVKVGRVRPEGLQFLEDIRKNCYLSLMLEISSLIIFLEVLRAVATRNAHKNTSR